jgi:hypothetical protein
MKALVVCELKVVEDDGILIQGVDYYDYVSSNVESFARLYNAQLRTASQAEIDPTQPVRLILVAPDFSQTLVNRCKWLNIPVSLFTYTCLKFEDENDLTPIFTKRQIPAPAAILQIPRIDDHLSYIADDSLRAKVTSLVERIKSWDPERISADATQDGISMKVNNRAFAYIGPRQKFCSISTLGADGEWNGYPFKGDEDLAAVEGPIKEALARTAEKITSKQECFECNLPAGERGPLKQCNLDAKHWYHPGPDCEGVHIPWCEDKQARKRKTKTVVGAGAGD